MENAVQLDIPLEIKLKTGPNWNDLQPYELPDSKILNDTTNQRTVQSFSQNDLLDVSICDVHESVDPSSILMETTLPLPHHAHGHALSSSSSFIVKNLFGNEG